MPIVVESCAECIERFGMVDGIYRLSGIASNIRALKSVNEFCPFHHIIRLNFDLHFYLSISDFVISFCRQSFDNCSESAARALSERLCHADPASARHDIHSVRYLQRGAVQVSLDFVAIICQSWDWEDLPGQEVAMVLLNQHMNQAG